LYSCKVWLLSTPHYWLLECIPSSWHVVSLVAYYLVYDKDEWTVAGVTHLMCSCSHAGRVNWKWWDYYLSSKSIHCVLMRDGWLHFTGLAGMSLVLISKECTCVCLCMPYSGKIWRAFKVGDFGETSYFLIWQILNLAIRSLNQK